MSYYELLQVTKDASTSEIKKSYYVLAKKYHPDKNKDDPRAEDIFLKIKVAYDVLSDADKRQQYDKFGADFASHAPKPEATQTAPKDPLAQYFRPKNPMRTRDLVHPLSLTLNELYAGTVKRVNVTRRITCLNCSGSGLKPGRQAVRCLPCQGMGRRMWTPNHAANPNGNQFAQGQMVLCENCVGKGDLIQPNDRCTLCVGRKTVEEAKYIKVEIEKGLKDGERVTHAGGGNEEPGWVTGDLVFVVSQLPHDDFTRVGDNLHVTTDIPLVNALTGFAFTVAHLDGRTLHLALTKGDVLRPSETRELPEQGMPIAGKYKQYGSLIINFNILFPVTIKDSDVETLKKILPPPPTFLPMPIPFNKKGSTGLQSPRDETFFLQSIDSSSFDRNDRPGGANHSDHKNAYEGDEDMDGNQNPAQCTQQ